MDSKEYTFINGAFISSGLVFSGDEIEVEEIKKDGEYHGIRVKTNCFLGNARNVLQLDIGFGDVVVPMPQMMECPINFFVPFLL
ncbi:hypothetical protein KPL35_11935 [Clostridium sp. CF011]|uniref:hypothetical protein n=1 Tax=unclassified Clostridium TaxID=2614128 RepID=UPI001C0C13A9|nr:MULTISPECIES: hypothetical protein [unclassified Clostridium]MBU3092783.1 hypothetical protein [Clostridium sp. CF011]MBW9145758.1 hypothetical protein [Clostridium sp. CM027]UVE42177.1 hypothetical protein KTC92_06950 [Clostridium sp. CM027]WAG71202.1 hypothetical protein LL036_07250 [Clostridium sp. CF011]